jgi:hypothetical protein
MTQNQAGINHETYYSVNGNLPGAVFIKMMLIKKNILTKVLLRIYLYLSDTTQTVY